tara:strand:- start:1161 stop:1940 length:780 start_codon:yes stop_codon:yes gene_type:complete
MTVNMRKKFDQNGYVSLRNVLTINEKKMIKNIIFDNFKEHIKLPKINKFDLENINFHKELINFRKSKPKKFGEIYDKINLNSKFRSLFYSKKFMNYFAKCLNIKNNNIYINGFMMRFDVPRDRRNKLNWHQDSPYYMMSYPKYNAGVCWCAITNNNRDNGTLKFIPKSHSRFIKTIGHKKGKYISEQYTLSILRNEITKLKDLNQKFGDMSLLHMNLKHRSGDNNSDRVRITIGCRFIDMTSSFNVGKEIYKFNDEKYN